jgi:cation:H+ antiporter
VSWLLVALGLSALYLGGEWLVRGASRLALLLRIAPMVMGLTLVAFGTSAPELAATIAAAFRGAPEMAMGNVIGSNITNIGLILGVTALVYPLVSSPSFLRREVPWMLAATALASLVLMDAQLTRGDGALLLAALVLFLFVMWRQGRAPALEGREAEGQIIKPLLLSAAGVGCLALGAQALVAGASEIAAGFGVSERVIGLTLVALGTSLPELASSLVAALRRETDIILGNIVGSNLFNLLAVLGAASLLRPISVELSTLRLDLWVMAGFSLLLLPLLYRRNRLGRSAALLLLAGYLGYVTMLFLPSAG